MQRNKTVEACWSSVAVSDLQTTSEGEHTSLNTYTLHTMCTPYKVHAPHYTTHHTMSHHATPHTTHHTLTYHTAHSTTPVLLMYNSSVCVPLVAGANIQRVLAVLDVLDSHSFSTCRAHNPISTLYVRIVAVQKSFEVRIIM